MLHAASLPLASVAAAALSTSGQSAAGVEQEVAPVLLAVLVGALAVLSEVGVGAQAESSVTIQSQGLGGVQQCIRAKSCRDKCCMYVCMSVCMYTCMCVCMHESISNLTIQSQGLGGVQQCIRAQFCRHKCYMYSCMCVMYACMYVHMYESISN